MRWSTEARYQILLSINNAVMTRTTREELFRALAKELRKNFPYDRLSINLYDSETESISYFATAHGINPEGISCKGSRPLSKGPITRMVIGSMEPVIIEDLTSYIDLPSIESMLEAGLRSTMAFPLVMRNRILGTIHFSFTRPPCYLKELTEVLTDVTNQVSIAVDNMLAYTHLKKINANLMRQRNFLIADADEGYKEDSFYFASRQMQDIMDLLKQVADTDASVLISGETGTGKDYLARYIHRYSSRRDNLFVKINCPALSASLFESELFGHAKGAFTGADVKRIGRFEMADKGTVFLDEVSELPLSLQAKMLNVLQEHCFERVGDSRPIEVDFRVVAATNRDLGVMIKEGKFRKDLFYRLNIVNVHVPPLRERVEDVPVLMRKLTGLQAKLINRLPPSYSEGAIDMLCRYQWPGNVRELKNLIKRMVILRPGDHIDAHDISALLGPFPDTPVAAGDLTLAEIERRHIEGVLIKCGGAVGGKNGAAKILGLPRSTLQYRLRKFNLNPSDYRASSF